MAETVLRLGPHEYAHVTNDNTNTTELVVGPLTRHVASHESIALPPTRCVVVAPTQYCLVANPHCVAVDAATGVAQPVRDAYGQVKVRSGEEEYRWHVPPFPLYPEESVVAIADLRVLTAHTALQIRVLAAYDVPLSSSGGSTPSTSPVRREAGERYLFRGPGTYYPRVEERVEKEVAACVVERGSALWCTTRETFTDSESGLQHYAGDKYMRVAAGMCFLQSCESLLRSVEGTVLRSEDGLHVQPTKTYTDPRSPFREAGVVRKANEPFLVTGDMCTCFALHPYDRVVKKVRRTHVSAAHYAVVLDSAGARRVVTDTVFFLQPGEKLEGGHLRPAYLLGEAEAVLVTAVGNFTDETCTPPVLRRGGDRWLVRGPCSFIPSDQVRVVPTAKTGGDVRRAYLLGEGDGLYVRNSVTGVVRCVPGPCSYLLTAEEELWEKPLSAVVERHLAQLVSHTAYIELEREQACKVLQGQTERAVSYHIPYRSVTQLYNYKTQVTRIVFGPDRVLLEPDEAFTVVSLSGSPWDPAKPTKCMPKQPNHITALHLFLGPSNMTDVVHVETRDHAQLALQLCYDWYFDVPAGDAAAARECFSVNDFVGDACSYIASRIRAAVASMPFEEFHKNSAQCLRRAVFDVDAATGQPRDVLRFPANHLVVTSVDTQEMEVLDERTRHGLQKSVKMAIEITTHAQEAEAQQVAMTREQEARGRLDRQRMRDQVANEEQRGVLLDAESSGLAIVSSGKSKAMAEALATASRIEGEASVEAATVRAAKELLLYNTMSELQHRKQQLLIEQEENVAQMTLSYERGLEAVRHTLMAGVVAALGPETIAEVAKAGPELQAQLLSSLGLEGYLVTDGSSPINLFTAADGLVGHA
ncbi:major vault protein [Novymonas esmeraldas]|uniref:Major vault protein n=1 Tax=Novymonas esmeraldas TaxID=1808958 RepID=A0AAW0EZT0_9TRYP